MSQKVFAAKVAWWYFM